MLAGHEHERLVGALAELRAELDTSGTACDVELLMPAPRGDGVLDALEEAQVRELGEALGGLAAAAANAHPPAEPLPESTTIGTVGGAEWLMRRELVAGRGERLAALVPDFVHLVTLPYLGREGAVAAAARSRELIASPQGGNQNGNGRAPGGSDGD